MTDIRSPYGHYPAGHYVPPPVPEPRNPLATAGFVVALVGAVLALIPILGIVSWVISPVGLVLSIVGLVQVGSRGGVGRGLATAGLVLGAVGLLVCVIYAAAFASAVGSTSTPARTYQAPSYSAPSYSAPTTTVAPDPQATGQYGSGTYEVGTGPNQIAPGTYRAAAGSSRCYYERLKNTEGTFSSIIANDGQYDGGPVTVTVKASDGAFKVSGDCVFVRR